MFRLSKNSKSTIEKIHPDLQLLIKTAIKLTPLDFGIPSDGGLRTKAQQLQLFRNGVSKCDGATKKSKHQSGNAVDFYAYIHGKASWEAHHLAILYGVFQTVAKQLEIKIKWGGTFGSSDFNGWDKGHLELCV